MRVLFFGTSAFAVPTLRALAACPEHHVIGVISQPDKPAGRGQTLTPSAVRHAAQELGVPSETPDDLKDSAWLTHIEKLMPDIFVVVAYGKFLPSTLCAIPRERAINLHPSLLPRYRGAAPIQWTLLNGDRMTAVSTLYVTDTMDAGNILLQWDVPVRPSDNAATLHDRLAQIGAAQILATLDGLATHAITPHAQDPARATHARKLSKEDGRIDWHRSVDEIANHVRGMTPWPGAFTTFRGKQLKIFRTEIARNDAVATEDQRPQTSAESTPGTVLANTRTLHIACGIGALFVTELQLEGGKRLTSEEFIRGQRVTIGEKFV